MLDMLQRIGPDMLRHIEEKLRIYLKDNVCAADDILLHAPGVKLNQAYGEVNTPMTKPMAIDAPGLCKKLVARALSFLSPKAVLGLINGWIQEQRVLALVKTVDSKDASVANILDAIRKYSDAIASGITEDKATETWLIAELTGRFLTDSEYIVDLALENLRIADFIPVLEKIICSETSKGNIGGKGAGLFIASRILDSAAKSDPLLADIKTPRTWYLAADQIVDFLHYNNIEELNAYKYIPIFHLRMTYDNVVAKIKNATLPPQTRHMLRIVLEELGNKPIIVRSSSLLEDRQSGAFSGKYKSLFLTNQGNRDERLDALVDAILEVYSSMYNPDSIQYRRERGLLNANEQMGVLIQEVIGKRIGPYYLPAFAGVAFSHNLFRWSPRVTKEGGLVRMVMGLGTRAVDRVNNDYPVLFSPSNPGLQVNQTPGDVRRYSPKHIDLINLEDGSFETVETARFFREAGRLFPGLDKYVSVYSDGFIRNKNAFSLDPLQDDLVVTFDHVLTATDIPAKLKRMLDVLFEKMKHPIDLEFAFDGEHIYLLQCRPQGSGMSTGPAPIPQNLKGQDILFTANRFISNGLLHGITHIVYVDGDGYNALSSREELLAVGEVIGLLNDILPRRQYILMGPGRWGSRGDIKLGVRVTYSDISGTAALIEMAKEKHSYVPELSFGTHFFQDMVESGIVYIPLYPDQKDVIFKERFFRHGDNILSELLPQYAWLSDMIRVIDVPRACPGHTLSIHMNSELEQAVAFLKSNNPDLKIEYTQKDSDDIAWQLSDERQHWQWRHYMAEQLAGSIEMEALGVKAVYLFGSTNNGKAGMGSDINLILHVDGNGSQRRLLEGWLDGWSRALAKINFLHTGYDTEMLLDAHLLTDDDIAQGDSFALKINATTDPAILLRTRK